MAVVSYLVSVYIDFDDLICCLSLTYFVIFFIHFRSTLLSRPNIVGLKRTSVCLSTKRFFNFKRPFS